ncbi:MAG: cation:proton antiporter [Bacteroidaceae bacterium]|nr:cation:proton antiporter [Bacteroidaceae bacterium]
MSVMIDLNSFFPITDTTWIFFIVLCIILFAPLLFTKLRMPHIIGMIFAGLLIGPHGFNILAYDSSFELFGDVGLFYIMFLASLEINMQEMKMAQGGAVLLGLTAFIFPLAIGVVANMTLLDYGLAASVLLASMYASHTLIAYPIVARYGLSRLRCVNFAVGGTIVTDTLTLFVLAVIGGLYKGDSGAWFFTALLLKMILLTMVIVFVFPRIARYFFRKYNDGIIQYIFVMAMLFLGAGLMELVGMEGILGAFITGLALNRLIPRSSPLMKHIEFVGNALFIPYFLIGVGMIINLKVLFGGGNALMVAGVMIVIALFGKWLASLVTQKVYGMSGDERRLMFGLSNAQAAATLAAVLVGYNIILEDGSRLLNDDVLNGTIVLILVTCVISSILTETSSRKIAMSGEVIDKPVDTMDKTLISLANPDMVDRLMNLAFLIRKEGSKVPLSAVNVVLDEDEKQMARGTKVLEKAEDIAATVNVPLLTKLRLTTNLSHGIIHEMKENNYTELIVGFHEKSSPNDSFLGTVLPELLTGLYCQIVMARLTMPINTIRCIHITFPAKTEFEAGFFHWVDQTERLAAGLDCRIKYHGHIDTMTLIQRHLKENKSKIRAEYFETDGGNDLKRISELVKEDHLLIVVSARRGSISFRPSLDHIFTQIQRNYTGRSILLIYPNGYSIDSDMTEMPPLI